MCLVPLALNQKELIDLDGVPILIRALGSTNENEELNQAIKYVLETCTNAGEGSNTFIETAFRSMFNFEVNLHKGSLIRVGLF